MEGNTLTGHNEGVEGTNVPVHSFSPLTMEAAISAIKKAGLPRDRITPNFCLQLLDSIWIDDRCVASRRHAEGFYLRNFPPIILQCIFDYLVRDTWPKLDGGMVWPFRGQGEQSWMDLSNASLVHPSWTWIAQKTMGRQVCIDESAWLFQICQALTKVHFGPWTKRVFISTPQVSVWLVPDNMISRQIRRLALTRERSAVDAVQLLVKFFKRIPNVESVTFENRVWFGIPVSPRNDLHLALFNQLNSLKSICKLSVTEVLSENMLSIVDQFARFVSQLPRLESTHVHLYDSGEDSRWQYGIDPILSTIPSPRHLSDLSLVFNDMMPLELINWLSKDSQLSSLNLSIEGSPYATDVEEDHLCNSSPLIAALNLEKYSATLQKLEFHSTFPQVRYEPGLIDILRRCPSLVDFHLGSQEVQLTENVLYMLPEPIVNFSFTVTDETHSINIGEMFLTSDEKDALDAEKWSRDTVGINNLQRLLVSWTNSATFRERHPHLQSISLVLRSITGSCPTGEFELVDRGLECLREACGTMNIVLTVKWTEYNSTRVYD